MIHNKELDGILWLEILKRIRIAGAFTLGSILNNNNILGCRKYKKDYINYLVENNEICSYGNIFNDDDPRKTYYRCT